MLVEALTNLKVAGIFRKEGDKFPLPDELVAKDKLIEKGLVKRMSVKPPSKSSPSTPWKKPGKKKTGGSGQASYPG